MKVAVEGCCHGELDNIYHTIQTAQTQAGIEAPDVLICCGDFQSFRNHSDLQTFAAPHKYRQLGSFWKYYNGEKIAPILTIFVGGNHEASGYLWELYHGGWVAPNIYFLGFAGSVILKKTLVDGTIDSIRISGLSGIFKKHDYYCGHYERLPYDNGTIRSIYHVREYDIFRINQLPISSSSDIFVSHDWPVGIEQYGNTAQLLRAKPFFRDEVTSNTLGSPPLMHVLKTIKPHYWFSAHLHVKFAALYHHNFDSKNFQPIVKTPVVLNPDELQIDSDEEGDIQKPCPTSSKPSLVNPDMIPINDSDEDETSLKKSVPNHSDPQAQSIINKHSEHLDATHLHGTDIAPLNPDELHINLDNDDDDKEENRTGPALLDSTMINPDMIPIKTSDDSTITLDKTQTNNSGQEALSLKNEPSDLTQNDVPLILEDHTQSLSSNTIMRTTRFLALDKCLPRKDFLQILDINQSNASAQVPIESAPSVLKQSIINTIEEQVPAPPDVNPEPDSKVTESKASLFFDPHWLAITRAFHSHMPLQKYGNPKLPSDVLEISRLINQELDWVNQNIPTELLEINNTQQFFKTAPGIGDPGGENTEQPLWYTNPQTVALTELLGIPNKINSPTLDLTK